MCGSEGCQDYKFIKKGLDLFTHEPFTFSKCKNFSAINHHNQYWTLEYVITIQKFCAIAQAPFSTQSIFYATP